MKILQQPPKHKEMEITCPKCKAHILIEADDFNSPNTITDPRDGDYYVFKCPCCHGTLTVQA